MKNKVNITLLGIILIIALFLRIFNLGNTPHGFHADEASFYINAVSISQNGMDEDGNSYPLSVKSFIDPKPAIYSYYQIPFINIMNDQVAASRMPSAILGILSILFLYLFIKKLSNQNLALINSFVLAISPWHIMMSRGTQEVISSFFFLTLSVYLVSLLQEKSFTKVKVIILTFSSFLSMYFYHSAKVLLPLVIFGLVIFYFKKTKNYIVNAGLILFITFIAAISSLLVQESISRASAVGILSDKKPQALLIEQIYNLHEELSITTTRVFYNKVQAYSLAITNEYMQYFSTDFLFIKGGKPFRYLVPYHGLIYLIEAPLLLFGIYLAISKKKHGWPLFLGIILLSPIPAALTNIETPSIIRSFPMVIGFSYFIALGFKEILESKNKLFKYSLLSILIVIYLWQITYFNIQYHIQAKYSMPWYRNNPYTQIAKEVAKISDNYDSIKITNDLRPLYSYFVMENLIDINTLQENPNARENENYSLGKFSFNRYDCNFDEFTPNTLYIVETICKDKNGKIKNLELVETITYNDGLEVYELLQLVE